MNDALTLPALMVQHRPYVRNLVRRILYRFPNDQDDVEGYVWQRVHVGLETFRGDSNPRSWIHSITVNASISWYRRLLGKGRVPLVDLSEAFEIPDTHAPSPEDQLLLEERNALVRDVLNTMAWQDFQLLTLRYYFGASVNEMAEILDRPMPTVKSQLWRARITMKRKLLDAGYRP